MRIALVNYGMGNLLSVRNALEFLGADLVEVDRGEKLSEASAIVLPGVGAFGVAMEELRVRGFVDALAEHVGERKKPFLGICLGLQLLSQRSFEQGEHEGLGWLSGEVSRIRVEPPLRVPHIGWSEVSGRGTLFAGIPERTAFYFVHSYHFALGAEDQGAVHGTTPYGPLDFTSAVERGNVMAVQFHPEKSHKWGLALLKNFLDFAGAA